MPHSVYLGLKLGFNLQPCKVDNKVEWMFFILIFYDISWIRFNLSVHLLQYANIHYALFKYSGYIDLIKGEGSLELECGPAWFSLLKYFR